MKEYFKEILFEKKKKRNLSINNLLKKDIEIITLSDLKYMVDYNLTVNDINLIGKKHKINLKGKKGERLYNCYNILFLKINVNKIIKCWKKYILNNIILTQGPARFKRSICNNNEDFLTMEKMEDIDLIYFFSFTDKDNFIYGFNVKSIKQMIDRKNLFNPYNRNPLSRKTLDMIKSRIIYNKCLGYNIDNEIQKDNNSIMLNQETNIKVKTTKIFQIIDSMGYITNIEWFISLNRIQNIKFIKELYDIWNYRASLTNEKKRQLCPSTNGNPFVTVNLQILNNRSISDLSLKNLTLKILSNFLDISIIDSNKNINAMYILSCLTLVSTDAANSLPWLYQSVANT